MASLSLHDAHAIAVECFPSGPEQIAEAMQVDVEYCALAGTDGWCMQGKGRTPKIRVNKNASKARQRFTLAHELAHLLLGTDPEIINQTVLPFQSVQKEERAADQLASELLIPLDHLRASVHELPVDAKTIRSLAKRSNVSDMVAAGRIVSEAENLGLINAALAVFHHEEFQWCWSLTLRNIRNAALALFPLAQRAMPAVYRSVANADGDVQTATIVGSPEYPVLLLQLLPTSVATSQTHHEVSRDLGDKLFGDNESFRASFNGCLSHFKSRAQDLTLEEAVRQFSDKYSRWPSDRLKMLLSEDGQAYLRHRLSAWTK
ncbi:MAG: ImmA/IrrE family metallo-endopeptidase [Phycisphaerales bacterium]